MEIIISFFLMIALLMFGVPVAIAFFGVSFFLILKCGYDPSFLMPFAYNKINNLLMLAMPLFILAGGIVEKGRIGEHLVNFVELVFGRIKGGTAIVAIISCAAFGAISGSSNATMTVIGSIVWPKMRKQGYSEGFATALLANCSQLGCFIPPSSIMIIYAWIANQSVLACFLASCGVGIMLMAIMSVFSYFWCKNSKFEPNISMPMTFSKGQFWPYAKRTTWKAIPALLFPVMILGGIYGGVMTPSEAAAVSVLYAVPVALFIYKGMKFKEIWSVLAEATTTVGVIMLMVYCVQMVSRIYIVEDLPGIMVDFLSSISDNRLVILLMINLMLTLLCMLMDDVSAMMLTVPIFLPIVTACDISGVHFAAIMAVNVCLGVLTPPCAPCLYLAGRLNNCELGPMLKPTMIMIAFIWFPSLLIVTFLPEIALFLPHLILDIPIYSLLF